MLLEELRLERDIGGSYVACPSATRGEFTIDGMALDAFALNACVGVGNTSVSAGIASAWHVVSHDGQWYLACLSD